MSRKTRKLIWAAPLLAVFAVAGALALFMALAPNPAQADEPPNAVTGLSGTADGRSTVNLTWTAPSTGTVTGYRIDRADADARVWMMLEADTGSAAPSYQDTYKLEASSTYNYRVYALNGDHTGPVSINPIYATVFTGAAEKPGPATGLTATKGDKALSKQITLKWNQPTDNGGADVVRYCIQYRQVDPAENFPALSTGNCTATTGATASSQINSIASSVSNGTADTNSVVIVVLASSVEADDGTASWDHKSTSFGDGARVEYRVTAVNSAGFSVNSSNTAEGETDVAPIPGMPTNIKLVGVDTDTEPATNDDDNHNPNVYLYWSRPAGLSAAATVTVQHRHYVPATGWTPATWDAATDLSQGTNDQHSQWNHDPAETVDTGKLRYRIKYTDGGKEGDWAYSDELSLPFPEADDANDNSLPKISAGNTGLRVVENSKYLNRIDLKWEREEFCADGNGTACGTGKKVKTSTYAIDVINNEQTDGSNPVPGATGGANLKWDRLTGTISFSTPAYQHLSNDAKKDATKLGSDEERHYRVFPWYAGRYGYPAVTTVSGKTKLANVPGGIAQGGLRVTADGATKLKLDWDAPANDGGSPVTHYLIQVSTDRDNDDKITDGETFTNWCDVTFRKASDSLMYTYDGKITSISKSGASCAGTTPPLAETGEKLKAGYARWFRVIPLNKKSNDPPDSAAAGWTVDDDAQPRATLSDGELRSESISTAIAVRGVTGSTTAPTAPMGLVAETAKNVHSLLTTQKGVLLTWAVPATGSASSYIIDRMVDGGSWVTLQAEHSNTSTDWTDPRIPKATEQFAYRVRARNEYGLSPWSNVAYFSGAGDLTMPGHTHIAASGTIPAQTVTMGTPKEIADVSMYFSDNTGATYAAMPKTDDDAKYVSAAVSGSMVTITGVDVTPADTTATITVTATDASGHNKATQDIMVTVTPAALGAPSNVVATIDDTDPAANDVIVTWTDGANADIHHVYLVPTDFDFAGIRQERVVSGTMTHTFTGVPADTYIVAVQSTGAADQGYKYAIGDELITVPAQ